VRDYIIVAIIALVVSLIVSFAVSINKSENVWKETAIEALTEANQYKAVNANNTDIVNRLIEDLKSLEIEEVNIILQKHGVKLGN
jgi:hypothetical protein